MHTAAHEADKIAIVLLISTESSASCTPAMTLPECLGALRVPTFQTRMERSRKTQQGCRSEWAEGQNRRYRWERWG